MIDFDIAYIDAVCCGDNQMKAELLQLFLEQSSIVPQELQALLAASDFDALARQAHKARSTVLSMGMNQTADALKKIEIIGKKLFVRNCEQQNCDAPMALYISQIKGLTPQINEWTDRNLNVVCVQELIAFCKLQFETASLEVSALIDSL